MVKFLTSIELIRIDNPLQGRKFEEYETLYFPASIGLWLWL